MTPSPDDELSTIATLQQAGRAAEARDRATALVTRLSAVVDHPGEPAARAYLALALHAAGRPVLALATLLEAALETGGFGADRHALAAHQARLVTAAMSEGAVTGD